MKFACDTKLVGKANSIDNIMQDDLNKLKNWADEMLMAFNVQKCGTIHFRFHNNNIKYKLGDYEINEVTEEYDLGIIVDSSLTFSRHSSN